MAKAKRMVRDALYCESYRPVVECGAVRVAKSMEEIRENIKKYLENPTQDSENRAKAVKFAMDPTDGYSYKRIAGYIDQILEKEKDK